MGFSLFGTSEKAAKNDPTTLQGNNAQFDEKDLISYIVKSGRDYIIQWQRNCSVVEHTKAHSLDYWLRGNYATNSDTKQAVNKVVNLRRATGFFEVAYNLRCPDSGNRCKGLRLKSIQDLA
jgi:hypothetical protein